MFGQTNYNFIKIGKKATTLMLLVLFISIICIIFKGFKFGLDFTGGVVFDLNITNNKHIEDKIRNNIISTHKDSVFQIHDGGLIIKIPNSDIEDKNKDVDEIMQVIKSIDDNITFNKIDFVGPQVGEVLIKNGIISIILSFVGILIYIWIRFKLEFSISAIIALVQGAIVLFGFISFFSIDFDLTTVAAILTVIGYSINDTIVIFDRIRENLKVYKGKNIENIVNISINNNLRRTLFTSVSTVLAILPLIFSTVDSLKNFSRVVILGVSIETYSSIFVASSLLIYGYRLNGVKK